jgi:hypothetical protein
MRRVVVGGLAAGFLLVGVAGCGGGLSASSSCADFAKASPEEQAEAISKLSSEFETPEITTPLGSPDVGYACAASPDMTLEALFRGYHEQEG